ncbi:MAG: pilus assembly protein TadG-related protein [Sphingomonas bacterium]
MIGWDKKMGGKRAEKTAFPRGSMSRLAHDVRDAPLAIMGALARLIGGCIDISGMYIPRTRLQHACDTGSPAGASGCLRNLHADREEQPLGGVAW